MHTLKKLTETTETETIGSIVIHLKSWLIMKYNTSTSTPSKMPRFGKGTECVKILLSQVSKDMFDPLIPMIFPYFVQK